MNEVGPQLEDGYTKIANEILEDLCHINLSAYQTRILHFIFRKTYGFNKKEDWISVSQIVSATGIHKSHVSRTKKELLLRKLVISNGNKIAFQKNSTLWKELPKEVTVTNLGQKVTNLGKKLPVQADTKETIQKKITKEIHPSKFPKEYLTAIPKQDIEEFHTKYEVDYDRINVMAQKILLYCESKGKIYRNYRSTLQNWLLDKYGFRKTPIKVKYDNIFDEKTQKFLLVPQKI